LICPGASFIGFIRCLLFILRQRPKPKLIPGAHRTSNQLPGLPCRSKEQGLRASKVIIAAANFYCNCGTPEPAASFLVCMISKATFETPLQNHIAVFDPH
jgi:hypothetical protein